MAAETDLYDLIIEANELRQKHVPTWDEAARFQESDQHFSEPALDPGIERFTWNRTLRATAGLAAILTESRPRVNVTPVEQGEEELFYLKPGVGQEIIARGAGAIFQTFDDMQVVGSAPLLRPQAQALMQILGLGEQAFTVVDDALVADALGEVHSTMHERSGGDFSLARGTFAKLTYGQQGYIHQWNPLKFHYEAVVPHQKNLWIDPDATSVEDAQYLVYGQRLDVRKAIRLYPNFERAIRDAAVGGMEADQVVADATLGNPHGVSYQRDMVIVLTGWVRDEMVDKPVEPGDAVARGLVGILPNGGFIGKGDVPLVWGGKGWPTEKRRGIAQYVQIGEEVVDRRACPFRDIPASWDINIPMNYKPYGMGEPALTQDLQVALNRAVGMMVEHTKQWQMPMVYGPMSVKRELDKAPGGADSAFGLQNRIWWIQDDLFKSFGGKMNFVQHPPALNETYMAWIQMLVAAFDEQAEQSNVARGQTDQDAKSGRAIKLLQDAARGVIGYRAVFTEQHLTQAAKLQLGMIVDMLPPDEWVRYTHKYPPAVLAAIRSRARSIEHDASVEIGAGKGAGRRQKLEEAIVIRQATQGRYPSSETILSATDSFDAKEEMRKAVEEELRIAQVAAAMSGGAAQGGEQNDNGSRGRSPQPSQARQ